MQKFILIIPARLKSKRLPDKPLLDINGKQMLLRTFEQCEKAVKRSQIIVATDDYRIKSFCDFNNINSIITSRNCLTGTDRVAEVSKKIKAKFYINVQGDEPLCNPKDIKKIIKFANLSPNSIINGFTKIKNKKDFFSSNIPKVIFDKFGSLIYISRAPIPFNKKKKFKNGFRQICIYSYPYYALNQYSKIKKKTFFENIEDIELIRFLEIGLPVKMIKMSDKSISVDTLKDLKRVRKLLIKKNGIS